MKKGASMVQVLAAQSGVGLKKIAQDLDRGLMESQEIKLVEIKEPTAKERQDQVRLLHTV